MAANTRFATGVHAMVLLAAEPDGLQTSEDVAGKLSINPVVIRRVFSLLHQAGLLESQKGPHGGSKLARPAKAIFEVNNLMGRPYASPLANEICP